MSHKSVTDGNSTPPMKNVNSLNQEEGIRKDKPFKTRLSQSCFLILHGGRFRFWPRYCISHSTEWHAGLDMNYAWKDSRSGDGHVGTDWCLYIIKERFFFFFYIMFYMIFSSSLCDCASNSKDPSVENCFFWASFNARNLCCPWAINNSWRSVLEEYHNVHVCTRLHLWAYTFSWMCDCVFSNVCFSNGKWRNSVEALDSYYIYSH